MRSVPSAKVIDREFGSLAQICAATLHLQAMLVGWYYNPLSSRRGCTYSDRHFRSNNTAPVLNHGQRRRLKHHKQVHVGATWISLLLLHFSHWTADYALRRNAKTVITCQYRNVAMPLESCDLQTRWRSCLQRMRSLLVLCRFCKLKWQKPCKRAI